MPPMGHRIPLTVLLLPLCRTMWRISDVHHSSLRRRMHLPVLLPMPIIHIPGIYTTELILGSETANVEVIVSDHAITSVSLADPSETLTTMYPLLEPAMESLNDQLCEMQDPSQVTYSAETRYTSLVLLEAIKASLEKAKPTATPEATGAPDATNAPAASPNVPKADINPAA